MGVYEGADTRVKLEHRYSSTTTHSVEVSIGISAGIFSASTQYSYSFTESLEDGQEYETGWDFGYCHILTNYQKMGWQRASLSSGVKRTRRSAAD